jgi:hypothetical protein
VGPRETRIGPPAVSTVRSFAERDPQILGIFDAQISGREICGRDEWRRETCWVRTLWAGRSEALGVIAETDIQARLRRAAILSAAQRLLRHLWEMAPAPPRWTGADAIAALLITRHQDRNSRSLPRRCSNFSCSISCLPSRTSRKLSGRRLSSFGLAAI